MIEFGVNLGFKTFHNIKTGKNILVKNLDSGITYTVIVGNDGKLVLTTYKKNSGILEKHTGTRMEILNMISSSILLTEEELKIDKKLLDIGFVRKWDDYFTSGPDVFPFAKYIREYSITHKNLIVYLEPQDIYHLTSEGKGNYVNYRDDLDGIIEYIKKHY
jgi:hypothetical protein